MKAAYALLLVVGCAGVDSDLDETTQAIDQGRSGRDLFEHETFGGNGRTCETCHSSETGTLDPARVQALFASDPDHPLFRPIDSDDGAGTSYTRLISSATIRVTLPLPPNVHIVEEPDARSVTLNRSIPTVHDIALESIFMLDGRERDLGAQAIGAVHAHYENTVEPAPQEADRIAQFQRGLFSSPELEHFAHNRNQPPPLPPGTTESEQRGRTFFVEGPRGLCAQCHSGPRLDTTNDLNIVQPGGSRFSTAFVSELNHVGNPVRTFVFELPDGRTLTMVSPDPGRGLVTGNPCGDVATVCNDVTALAVFKIPSLRSVGKTAPYFHDNSAATLEAVIDHYEIYFTLTAILDNAPEFILTPQDKADIVAYLRLL
jgi:hypothetical protein